MARPRVHKDEDEPEVDPETAAEKELRVKRNLQGFNAKEAGFVHRDGVIYRPNGKPAAMCPMCTLPGTVVRVLGVFRQHRCCGYATTSDDTFLGCGHLWWTMAWKTDRGPF